MPAVNSPHIFISYSREDADFVNELREALESYGFSVWLAPRDLPIGAVTFAREINGAIEQARQFIVVISVNSINSPWVRKEIQKALEVERARKGEGYRVIPILLPGVEPSALALWSGEEPLGVRVEIKAGGVSEALPQILAAVGAPATPPVEELILRLSDLKIESINGRRRAQAVAQLVYEPADESAPAVESRRFTFTAPLGVIEQEELRWYLEEYHVWPIGVFRERAERIESQLPKWGLDLYQAALAPMLVQEAFAAWQRVDVDRERRFSVLVDSELPDGASQEDQAMAREAATELLSLPWELLHDGQAFLFRANPPVRVRRRLPNRLQQPVMPTRLPIRILLVSPRPETEHAAYIDHRLTARPLVDAIEDLGELVELVMLAPPTFPALEEALRKADEAGEPFDVVHFDGHGIYDRNVGLGVLLFEHPQDVRRLDQRAAQAISSETLAEVIRLYRIPLVFLESCQSGKAEGDPTTSVSAKLLEEGTASVVAMSHNILTETAHRFVKAFYRELAQGKRVGTAMLAGQRELYQDTDRGKLMGVGELRLQDWFVPVLYQEEQDPRLVLKLPSSDAPQLRGRPRLQDIRRRLRLGALPDPPAHGFQGRSRELLALERLLHDEPWAVIRGRAGVGKSALAIELARWLVRVGRFRQAAFVSLEQYTDVRSVLDSIGRQLLPEGDNWSVAGYPVWEQAIQPVEQALADRPTIIILDNMESISPDQTRGSRSEGADVAELLQLCRKLLAASPATRIVFTSRGSLPAPFDDNRRGIGLGPLSREDAIKIVGEVMKQEGLVPKSDDPGSEPEEITGLVEAVNHHARALVLLAREVARRGVRATPQNLHQIMAELGRRNPNDRESSLYASVELSLRRLRPETREQIKALSMFHGGLTLNVLAQMLGVDTDAARGLIEQLIRVGLAEEIEYTHFLLDPALPSYLSREMGEEELRATAERWSEAMKQFTKFLYQLQFTEAEVARRLTWLETANLTGLLVWIEGKATAEEIVDLASSVESLLSLIERKDALQQAARVRAEAARELEELGHARFVAESAEINRLMGLGQLRPAYEAAQRLLQQHLEEEEAYPDAGYDVAYAHWQLGRVLQMQGSASEALGLLDEARRRFLAMGQDDIAAQRMAAVASTESGDCFMVLGDLDSASEMYDEAVRQLSSLNDRRTEAINRGQLGTVRLLQQRYTAALQMYHEVRAVFESLGEPASVATAWHQIGLTHKEAGQFEQAERAYRQALAISVRHKSRTGGFVSLGELGNLYDAMGRLEDAVKCYREAIDISVMLLDQMSEGINRSNLAATLIELQRYQEARSEINRAIECNQPFGYAAQPWKTLGLLYNLEQAMGNTEAAADARERVRESYEGYRRSGGHSVTTGAELCDQTAEAIEQGAPSRVEQQIARLLEGQVTVSSRVMIEKLQSILSGDRNPSLADDPRLFYHDAVELELLLERLNSR